MSKPIVVGLRDYVPWGIWPPGGEGISGDEIGIYTERSG